MQGYGDGEGYCIANSNANNRIDEPPEFYVWEDAEVEAEYGEFGEANGQRV